MRPDPAALPPRWLAAALGVLSTAAGLGVAHLVAAVTVPAASPLLAVGSVAIDAAPTPVKEWAVRSFGTADKPILLGGIAAVLVLVTAVLGIVASRRRWVGIVGLLALGGIAGAAAAARSPEIVAWLPAVVAAEVAVALLVVLLRAAAPAPRSAAGVESGSGRSPATPLDGPHVRAGRLRPRRRGVLLGGPALLAAVGVGGGTLVSQLRTSDAAVGRDQQLPQPADPAQPLPDDVQIDLDGVTPFVTPLPDFYRVDIALTTPRLDASTWSLPIEGMVERPLTLSYADLLERPLVERWITLSCVSNPIGGPYVSTGRWLGIPLADLLDEVGVQPGAEQLFAEGADGFSCSIPLETVRDGRDALLVVGINGEQLPLERGFPARLVVPGLFGFVSAAKWLTGLRVSTYEEDVAYWTERGWATEAPVLTQTRIDVPSALASVPAGEVTIAGMAWAQHRGIEKVEVSIDGGDWQEAELAADAGPDLWRAWSHRWNSTGAGRHDVQVRSTDGTGETQPEERTEPFPDGARGWHSIAFMVEG